MKVLNRGEHNSCSRCDLIFKPVKPREERDRERKTQSVSSTPSKEEPKVRKYWKIYDRNVVFFAICVDAIVNIWWTFMLLSLIYGGIFLPFISVT